MEEKEGIRKWIRNEVTRQGWKHKGTPRYSNGKTRTDRRGEKLAGLTTKVNNLQMQVNQLQGLTTKVNNLQMQVNQLQGTISMMLGAQVPGMMMMPGMMVPPPLHPIPPPLHPMHLGQPVHYGQAPVHYGQAPVQYGQALFSAHKSGFDPFSTSSTSSAVGIPASAALPSQPIQVGSFDTAAFSVTSYSTNQSASMQPDMFRSSGEASSSIGAVDTVTSPMCSELKRYETSSPSTSSPSTSSPSTSSDKPAKSTESTKTGPNKRRQAELKRSETSSPSTSSELKKPDKPSIITLHNLKEIISSNNNHNQNLNKSNNNELKSGSLEVTLNEALRSSLIMPSAKSTESTKKTGPWKNKRRQASEGMIRDDTTVLRGQIVSILNKITPDNFSMTSEQMLDLKIDNQEKLEVAADIIFEKVLSEPTFSQTYAYLCRAMGSIRFPEEQNATVSPFRKAMLKRLKTEFLRERSDEENISKKMEYLLARTDLTDENKTMEVEELMYQRSKLKKRMLTNINFIGELFNRSMIPSKLIISECIEKLLAKRDKEGKLEDDVVECLARFFKKCGSKLESSNDEDTRRAFKKSFYTFKGLVTCSNRTRMLIEDVVELRTNNWVPRREEAKPKPIEDIHREHALEEKQMNMEASSRRKSKYRVDNRDGGHSRDSRHDDLRLKRTKH